jgi:hypothetical protein
MSRPDRFRQFRRHGMEPRRRRRHLAQFTDHRPRVENVVRPQTIPLQHPGACHEIVEVERPQQRTHIRGDGDRSSPDVDAAGTRIFSTVYVVDDDRHVAVDLLRARIEELESERRGPEHAGDEENPERVIRPRLAVQGCAKEHRVDVRHDVDLRGIEHLRLLPCQRAAFAPDRAIDRGRLGCHRAR